MKQSMVSKHRQKDGSQMQKMPSMPSRSIPETEITTTDDSNPKQAMGKCRSRLLWTIPIRGADPCGNRRENKIPGSGNCEQHLC